jgi:hypothetical protein
VIGYKGGHLVDILSYASAGVPRGARQGGKIPPRGESLEIQKMKNSGNEAKKYLKTKEEH